MSDQSNQVYELLNGLADAQTQIQFLHEQIADTLAPSSPDPVTLQTLMTEVRQLQELLALARSTASTR